MKRKFEKADKVIKEIYPRFFWLKCCSCDNEFKKEKGYSFSVYVPNERMLIFTDKYICSDCAKDKEDAFKIAELHGVCRGR